MEEKPSYYAIIPANVRYNERLNSSQKLFYGEITALTQKTGECWASNNYFANLYKVSTASISNWVKTLEKEQLITIEYIRNGKEIEKRIIKIMSSQNTDHVVNLFDEGSQNTEQGYSENFKENNTSINNTSINNKEIYKESWDCDEYVKNLTDAEIGYLNELTGKNYRTNNPKTISLIRARLKDGFKAIDIMRVIETKCDEWLDTDMEKYLRPETLFGNKFENYVNQRRKK